MPVAASNPANLIQPETQAAVAQCVAESSSAGTPVNVNIVGGGTSCNFGPASSRPGVELSLAKLDKVIDYPARDMTITVEAGVTLATLADTLSSEGQWLPIEVPQADRATVGGAIATATSGARRYGYGTWRDYVIGVTAVDGRGEVFHAGGRVVKNVAGYDFCKLLTGSLGTLGVITQVSLKVKPRPEATAFLVADLHDLETATRLLAALVTSAITPVAIELLAGPAWRENEALGWQTAGIAYRLAVGVDGTEQEVAWMLQTLAREWEALGVRESRSLVGPTAAKLWRDLAEFPAADAALTVKASVPSSQVTAMVALLQEVSRTVSIQAHAGNGILVARFNDFEPADVSTKLIGRIQPAVDTAGGHVVVLGSSLDGLTRRAIWGAAPPGLSWMAKVRAQFDPQGILNPGRFVFAD